MSEQIDDAVKMLPDGLMARIRRDFRLDWTGVHGAPHWARVMRLGLLLARDTGADPRVVCLFAVLHDNHRIDDGWDPGHGERAAGAVLRMHRRGLLGLDDRRATILAKACAGHSDGGQ